MKQYFLVAFVLLSSWGASAQNLKPVSLSYENLIRCFPELKDENQQIKIDLPRLKDSVDIAFITTHSMMKQRKITYRSAENSDFILLVKTKRMLSKKPETELSLQKVDAKGVFSEVSLPLTQRLNPSKDTINSFLVSGDVKSDEKQIVDTKPNGISLSYRQNFKEITNFELVDDQNKRNLYCEKRHDLGVVCTCSKK